MLIVRRLKLSRHAAQIVWQVVLVRFLENCPWNMHIRRATGIPRIRALKELETNKTELKVIKLKF
jgi:hypothetical protein